MIKHDSSCGGARLNYEAIRTFAHTFGPELDRVFAQSDVPTFIVNKFRQVVYMNPAFHACAEQHAGSDILGCRIGEIMQCDNSPLSLSGCGTSLNCHDCGYNRALCDVFNGALPSDGVRLKVKGNPPPDTWSLAFLRLNDEPHVVCTRSN